MTLSLSMIVRDEAEHLATCLDSVVDLVDELVIVDTGSVDDTPAIAQSYGAIVHTFTWQDDFAAARNAALAHTTGDWVLVLDADEVLVADCMSHLKAALNQPDTLVIQLLRQEIGAQQSPYSLLSRLFRRHPALRFTRPYHESIDDSVLALQAQAPQWHVRTLPGIAIQHIGYQAVQIQSRQKSERARRIMHAYWQQHPEDLYIVSKLGALYLDQGELEAGITLLEQGIRAQPQEAAIAFELHYHLGIGYAQLQHWERAALHYQAAIQQEVLPHLKLSAYNNFGSLLQELGYWPEAAQAFAMTIEIDPNFAVGHYNLGITRRSQNDLPGAIAHYQRAIELQPDYADAYRNLGVALYKLGRRADSLDAFRQAIAVYEQQHSPEAQTLREGVISLGLPL